MTKYTHKITQAGRHSLSVVIPKQITKELKFRERQKVNIYKSGKKIIIEDWKK